MDSDLTLLARSVSNAADIESGVRPLLKLVKRTSGLDSVYLTTVDKSAGEQRILFSENSKELTITEGLCVPWEDTLCKRALEESNSVMDNLAQHYDQLDAVRELSIQTYTSVPVYNFNNNLYGTLCGVSGKNVAVSEEVTDLFYLCAELIAAQVERHQRALRAERRAQLAEKRLSKVAMSSRITGCCLEASALRAAILQIADLLKQDKSWSRVDAFLVSGNQPESISGVNSIELAKQVLETDHDTLQLIVKKQEEPVLWADAEEQVLALVITSDTEVAALMMVYMQRDLKDCSDSMHILTNAAFSLSLLAARLADHSRLEAANQVLEQHALHDVLTGLPNRRYLIEMLDGKLLEGERLEAPVYIAFVDLDGFKKINDEYGHDTGDAFLQEFTARLNTVLRGHDLVARYGGDEFVMVCIGSPDDQFERIRDSLIERIRNVTSGSYVLEEAEFDYSGPSIGLIEWQPGEMRDADVAISRADEAMYEDKKQRRSSSTVKSS